MANDRSHSEIMLTQKRLSIFVLSVSIAVLGGAHAFQYLGGLAPCPLCMYQRYAYFLAIPVSALAIMLASRESAKQIVTLLLTVCFLAILAGGVVAGYHTGVEQKWWPGPDTCSAITGNADVVEDLLGQINATTVVRCDEVPWSLFGVSMAGYNFLISAVMGVVIFSGLRREILN